ncbi:MAG: response regulator transcription factor [Opitutales bacterium]
MKAWQNRPRPDLLQRLPECIATISRLETTSEVGRYLATEITELIGAEFGGFALHDLETSFNEIAASEKPTTDVLRAGENLYHFNHQLPRAHEALEGRLQRFSANIEQEYGIPHFQSLDVYEHVYKMLGGPYVLIHHSEPLPRVWAGGCYVRKRSGFSEDEARFLEAISTVAHLRNSLIAQVQSSLQDRFRSRDSLATQGGLVIFSDEGAIFHASAGGGEALAKTGLGSKGLFMLPDQLCQQLPALIAGAQTHAQWRLGEGRKLILEGLAPHPGTDCFQGHFRLVQPGSQTPATLTQREGEVSHWVAQGKSNPEIATILGISPRTVAKHVEHILEKLGLENRVALATHWHGRPPSL